MAVVSLTSLYGGKPYPIWNTGDFVLPGYKNATIEFINLDTGNIDDKVGFLISPTSMSEQRGNDIQAEKTLGGWWLFKTGKSIGSLSLSGYVLDTLKVPERAHFLDKYKTYIEDKRNSHNEFYNEWYQVINIEGRLYTGCIQNISTSKSGVQPFLYQYNINFLVLNDKQGHFVDEGSSLSSDMLDELAGAKLIESHAIAYYNQLNEDTALSQSLYSILKKG